MRTAPDLTTAIIAIFGGVILLESFCNANKPETVYFPIIMGLITFIMAIPQIFMDCNPSKASKLVPFIKPNQKTNVEEQKHNDIKALRIFGWLIAYVLLTPIINYLILAPLFSLVIMRVEGRMRWVTVLATTGGIEVFLFIFFHHILVIRIGRFPII